MSLELEKLFAASYNGKKFLISRGTTSFGRKTAVHEFINKDDRSVEDLGRFNTKFVVTGVITGPDYFEKRDGLIAELKKPGPGQLIHPFYGTKTVSLVGEAIVDEDQTRIGEAIITMTFLETVETPIFPIQTTSQPAAILQSVRRSNTSIANFIGNNFLVSRQFPNNFVNAEELLNGYVNRFTTAVSQITTNSTLSTFNVSLDNFQNNIRRLISDPLELGVDFIALYDQYQELADTPKTQVALNEVFFNFGNDDVFFKELTFERVQRNRNRNIINVNTQALALQNAYQATVELDFFDEQSLERSRDGLETQYDAVIEEPELDPEVRQEVQISRNIAREFFKEQEGNVFRVSEIETRAIPITILAYQYYGNVDLTEQLIQLNDTVYPSAVEGTQKLFTL